MDQLAVINLRAKWQRLLLVLPVALALVGVWFVVRWHIGNTLASPQGAPDLELAQAAIKLAPDDPQTHFTLARLRSRTFLPEELAEAMRLLEQATALSPNDYRLWMELGRAREQAGNAEGGERALRRAAELAPHYADPRWFLGNLLLRQARYDEAFAELRLAGERYPERFRAQVFNVAWQVYSGDITRVAAAVGDSAQARASLAGYLLSLGHKDEALRLWATLSAADKRAQRTTGETIFQNLLAANQYHAALNIYREIAPEGEPTPALGQIMNGGFEEEIAAPGRSLFGWQVTQAPQARIHIDPRVGRSGERSLRVTLNAPEAFEWRNLSQFIVVESQARYRLQYYVRAEELKGLGTPVAYVLDAGSRGQLASSETLPEGTSEWRQVALEFTTAARTEAVMLIIARGDCPFPTCPIFGRIWYDDFNLQRLSGSGRADGRTQQGGAASNAHAGSR